MAIQEIKVWHKTKDSKGDSTCREAERTLGIKTGPIQTRRVYWIQGVTPEDAKTLGEELLADPVIQEFAVNPPPDNDGLSRVVVTLQPAQTDPENQFIQGTAEVLGIKPEAIKTGWEYGFSPAVSKEDRAIILRRLLVNPTVEEIVMEKPTTLLVEGEADWVREISLLSHSKEQAQEVLAKNGFRFSPEEAQAIFKEAERRGRDFNDLEVASIEQNWSEHSGHKTTKATLVVDGQPKPSIISRIKETSFRFKDKIVTAFDDNAGGIRLCSRYVPVTENSPETVVKLGDGYVIIAKGETHNHPVKIGPLQGALTRTGGLIRDIAALGRVGHNLFGFDINCFAPPDLPYEQVPPGHHHPDYLLRQNFSGIRDYGNRMGIPTVSARFYFHPDFRANIVSLGVAFGIIPEDKVFKKEPQPGQEIWIVGGRTGRDGVNGAVGSSHAATIESNAKAAAEVQMGNPIEEKRVFDALEEGRDEDLWEIVHDLGGGGASATVSEVVEGIGGVIDLDQIRRKDNTLSPREVYLSEAQERMLVIVDPSKISQAERVFRKHDVEINKVGRLTGDKKLVIYSQGKVVGDLDIDFLRHGCPKRVLEAEWIPPLEDKRMPELPKDAAEWVEVYKKVLGHWNCSSTEPIVRQYDHGVQAHTVLAPFTGVYQDVLNDAYVCQPLSDRPYGMIAAHDLHPVLNRIDPYWASIWTVASAATRLAVVGGDYREAAYIDNYIWPAPNKENLGSLDRATDGFCAGMTITIDPAVSGKDSLGGTTILDGERLDIPPVLNISIFGSMPDASKTSSVDFKRTNSVICLVGNIDPDRMAGSTYFDTCGLVGTEHPRVDVESLPAVLESIPEGIRTRKVLAAHSTSHGGLGKVLAEMCFGGDCGADIDLLVLGDMRPDNLFNETSGTALVEVTNEEDARELFANVPYKVIGRTRIEREITINHKGRLLFTAALDELKQPWQEKFKGVIQ